MNYEKWQQTIELVKSNYEVENEGRNKLDEFTTEEFVEFKKDNELFRLELITKPKVKEKRTLYSKRIGSDTTERVVYDEKERVYVFRVYKFNVDGWEEISSPLFN